MLFGGLEHPVPGRRMPLLQHLQQPSVCPYPCQALIMLHPISRCLIMSANVAVGSQVAALLDGLGWQIDVVHSSCRARDMLLSGRIDVVVADVDTNDLGGLAFLALCRDRYPGIMTFAIVQSDDAYGKRMGRDAGGCQGFFYLTQDSLRMDFKRGMAVTLAGKGRVLATGRS